jgi:epoxyqueuosine reductase
MASLLRETLESLAKARGFSRIGIAPAVGPPHDAGFRRWIAEGRHGSMAYLEKTRQLRSDPRTLLSGARSIIVLASSYPAGEPAAADGARVARYALAADYHRTLRAKCESLVEEWKAKTGARMRHRVCVDSAPLAERDFAAVAGIGWIGKNGMVLNEGGSYFLLCEILTDLPLPFDGPVEERCGSCTRCLDACPTSAFLEPGVLDATRCLSYWTIEQRGPIPESIVAHMGGWVFGCDLCQEACPYNRAIEPEAFERQPSALSELLEMRASQWRRRFRDTPVSRAGAAGIRRNAAAVAESLSRRDLLPALQALAASPHPSVSRQAAAAVDHLTSDLP